MKILKSVGILIALIWSASATAQNVGDVCNNPINFFNGGNECTGTIFAARGETWYQLLIAKPAFTFSVQDMGSAPGRTDKLVLYSGSCGNLIPIDSVVRQINDTILVITKSYMTTGVYFVKAVHSGPSSCRTCNDPQTSTQACLTQAENPGFCGFDIANAYNQANNPGYNVLTTAQDQYIYNYVHSHSNIAGPFTIPVVVHVLHFGDAYGAGTNIPYDQIQWQIAAMNAAFQHDYANYNQQTYGHQYASYGYQDYSSNP